VTVFPERIVFLAPAGTRSVIRDVVQPQGLRMGDLLREALARHLEAKGVDLPALLQERRPGTYQERAA
jgi:hypothetical protein